MPILDIQIVTDDSSHAETWAQQLADAAGEVLRSENGTVWVKLQFLDPHLYAENKIPRFSTPRPVFVKIALQSLPTTVELEAQSRTLADRFAAVMELPSQWIHLIYEPPVAGRVAFGGELNPH